MLAVYLKLEYPATFGEESQDFFKNKIRQNVFIYLSLHIFFYWITYIFIVDFLNLRMMTTNS